MSSGWNTPKPVEYEGVVYPSLAALAKKYGLDKSSVSYRLKHGIPLDRPVRSGGCKPASMAERGMRALRTSRAGWGSTSARQGS